eukprot:scaffold7575_cov102-Isochrysis_galbana.AAC.2
MGDTPRDDPPNTTKTGAGGDQKHGALSLLHNQNLDCGAASAVVRPPGGESRTSSVLKPGGPSARPDHVHALYPRSPDPARRRPPAHRHPYVFPSVLIHLLAQPRGALDAIARLGLVSGGEARAVGLVKIGSVPEQQLARLEMARLGRADEGRVGIAVLAVDLGAPLEQQLHGPHVTVVGRLLDGGGLARV